MTKYLSDKHDIKDANSFILKGILVDKYIDNPGMSFLLQMKIAEGEEKNAIAKEIDCNGTQAPVNPVNNVTDVRNLLIEELNKSDSNLGEAQDNFLIKILNLLKGLNENFDVEKFQEHANGLNSKEEQENLLKEFKKHERFLNKENGYIDSLIEFLKKNDDLDLGTFNSLTIFLWNKFEFLRRAIRF